MATKKVTTSTKPMNVSPDRRMHLARHAGYELEAWEPLVREQLRNMVSCDSMSEEVAIHAFLDRVKSLACLLMAVGSPEDDRAHDDAVLSELVRIASDRDEKAAA
jgi:hypothetical protein